MKLAKDSPNYSLKDICEAARKGNINQRGPKVQLDIDNLKYTDTDVANCLCQLDSSEFRKVLIYKSPKGNFTEVYDVYLTHFTNGAGNVDAVYVKIRYNSTWITLGSFHL